VKKRRCALWRVHGWHVVFGFISPFQVTRTTVQEPERHDPGGRSTSTSRTCPTRDDIKKTKPIEPRLLLARPGGHGEGSLTTWQATGARGKELVTVSLGWTLRVGSSNRRASRSLPSPGPGDGRFKMPIAASDKGWLMWAPLLAAESHDISRDLADKIGGFLSLCHQLTPALGREPTKLSKFLELPRLSRSLSQPTSTQPQTPDPLHTRQNGQAH
jgi:hypothetical protein